MLKMIRAEENENQTGDIDLVINHEDSKYCLKSEKFLRKLVDLDLKKNKPTYTKGSKKKLLVCLLNLYCNLKERAMKYKFTKSKGAKKEKSKHKVNPSLHVHLNYQFYHRKGVSSGKKHPFFEQNMAKYQWSYRRVRDSYKILLKYGIVKKTLVNNSRKDSDKLRIKCTVIQLNSINQWDIEALMALGITFNDLLLVSQSGWDLSETDDEFERGPSDEILVTLKQEGEKRELNHEEISSCPVAEHTLKELRKINLFIQSKSRSKEEYELFRYYKIAYSNQLPEWGRFYSSYLEIEKALKRIYLKENYLIELDRKASVFNLLYLYATGAQYKDDPYLKFTENTLALMNKSHLIKDYEMAQVIRVIFKKIIMAFLNTSSNKGCSSSLTQLLLSFGLCSQEQFKKSKGYIADEMDWPDKETLTQPDLIYYQLGEKYSKDLLAVIQEELNTISIYQLKDAFFGTFPELKPYLFNQKLFNTMIMIESQITLDLLKVIHARGFLPISIHDAVYVPVDLSEEFKILQDELIEKNMKDYKLKQGKYADS